MEKKLKMDKFKFQDRLEDFQKQANDLKPWCSGLWSDYETELIQKIRNTCFGKMVDENPAHISEDSGFPAWSFINYTCLRKHDLFEERSRIMSNHCHLGLYALGSLSNTVLDHNHLTAKL
jgi:hypothetical protein